MEIEILSITRSINKAQLLEIVPLAHSTIWAMEQTGDFPKRFYLTPRTPAWDHDAVLAWLRDRQAKPIKRKSSDAPDVRKRVMNPVRASQA